MNEVIRGNFGRDQGQPARMDELRKLLSETSPEDRVSVAVNSIVELRDLFGDDITKAQFQKDYLDFVSTVLRRFDSEEQDKILAQVGVEKVGGDNVIGLREE
jgi:hypothetical protein